MPYVIGKHALIELLNNAKEKIKKVYLANNELVSQLEGKRVSYEIVSKDRLTKLCGYDMHQGVVVEIIEREFIPLSDFLQNSEEKSIVLMCDNISDTQNFGSLARLCDCFGVDALVFSKNRGAEITPFAAKAASGAFELINLIRVSNLYDSVLKFKENGYSVVIADVSENSKSINDFTFSKKTLLVVGSEGFGVQPLIKKAADFIVKIELLGKIDSLNVAQATAIFLYKFNQNSPKNWNFYLIRPSLTLINHFIIDLINKLIYLFLLKRRNLWHVV